MHALRHRGAITALGFTVMGFFSVSSYAQTTFGDIRGVTSDQQNLALSRTQVTVHSIDDNTNHVVLSDEAGQFLVDNLKPGRYEISAQKEGFASSPATLVELSARQSLRVDLTLGLEQHTEVVNVDTAAEQINTENGIISDSKVNADITHLPLNSRATTTSPLSALMLSPNVQQDSQGNIALGGATASMVGFSVDGISTANVRQNGALQNTYPSSESIAEVKVTAFNNNAEFSQVGDVTFTTRNGTNTPHGSLFEYLQNDALDAKILNFAEKAPKRFNTFGGSIGGPVVLPKLYDGHNKTFFFFDYEGNRRRISSPQQYLVPTVSERSGNLTGLVSPGSLVDPSSGRPFPNDTIPVSRINPTASSLLNNYYPLPNTNSGGSAFNFEQLTPIPSNTNGADLRIDHNITDKQQVYARYSYKNIMTNVANPLLPNDVDIEHDRSFLLSYNYTLTPTLLNEFRFGFTNSLVNVNFPIEGAAALAQLGLTGVDISQHPTTDAFPTFNFSDGTGFTPIGRDKTGTTKSDTMEFSDNLSYTRGSHTMKFGVNVRRVRYFDIETFQPSDDFGQFTFNQGAFTGSAFGDLLVGAPNTAFFAVSSPDVDGRTTQTGAFAQDEWQVNRRLTVNFGLRWELLPAFQEQLGDLANFDPALNAIVVPNKLLTTLGPTQGFLQSFNSCGLQQRNTSLACTQFLTASQAHLSQGLRNLYWKNFQPRVSVAYRPFASNKTVLRAGFGIFTVTNLGPLSFNNSGNPTSTLHTYANNANGVPLFAFPLTSPPNQATTYGGGSLDQGVDPNYRDPQSAQWNVTLEQALNASTSLRVSYVGMNSYRLSVTEDLNQIPSSTTPYVANPFVDPRAPYQNWFALLSSENAGFANYQAMEVEVNHRMASGLSFQANYTLAKNLSDAQGDAPTGFAPEVLYGQAVTNRFDLAANRGNVAGTRRNRLLLTGTYQLPFGKGRKFETRSSLLNLVTGGWDLTTVTLIESGPWLTPTIGAAFDQSNTDALARSTVVRPDLVGDPTPVNQTHGNYYNLSAFAPTPAGAGRIGDAGVGILQGPGTVSVNAGLAKTFDLTERFKLRFESTFTNVFNHTNFAPPATNVSNPSTFGVLIAAQTAENGGNRTGQVALRLDF
jgi:Carboxypeptidase regulatory-like domain